MTENVLPAAFVDFIDCRSTSPSNATFLQYFMPERPLTVTSTERIKLLYSIKESEVFTVNGYFRHSRVDA